MRLPPIHQKRYNVSESQDGMRMDGADVNSLKESKAFNRNKTGVKSEKKLNVNERDKARQFLAAAANEEEDLNIKYKGDN